MILLVSIRIFGSLWRTVSTSLGLDIRSLALFRVILGITIFGDLVDRASDLHAHYTDLGVYNRQDIITHYISDYNYVVHFINGSWWFMACLFGLHMISSLMFAFGYYTRTNNFIVWFLSLSLQEASPFVGHSGDVYARMLLFWSIFLPMGEVWSVDATLKSWHQQHYVSIKNKSYNHFSVATVGLLTHIVFVYCFSYAHKSGSEWLIDHTSVFYALQLDYFQTSFARFLLTLPDWILKYMCVFTLIWEKYGPFTFMIPFKNDYWRILGCLGFWAMHMGFGLSLRLGLFLYITITCFFSCIPSMFWDRWFMPYIRTKDRLSIQLTDLAFWLKFFMLEETPILSLQSKDNHGTLSTYMKDYHEKDTDVVTINMESNINSSPGDPTPDSPWLIVKEGNGHELNNLRALIICCKAAPLLYWFGWILAKLPARFTWYLEIWAEISAVVTHTNKISFQQKYSSSHSPLKKQYRLLKRAWYITLKIGVQVILLYIIYLAFCWNMNGIGVEGWEPPDNMKWIVYITRIGMSQISVKVWIVLLFFFLFVNYYIDQSWHMFSPYPPKASWWLWIEGELFNEKKVELFKNEGLFTWQPSYDMDDSPPVPFHLSFKNHRWFKYFENGLTQPNSDHLKLSFGRYICREFNKRNVGQELLSTHKIWLVTHVVDLNGKKTRTGKQLLWSHQCYTTEIK